MASPTQTETAELLDRRLPELQAAAQVLKYRPPKGWVSAIRTALGMSGVAFAKLLNVSQPTAYQYEKSEAQGTISLETLSRIAAALEADLVIALVPRKSVAVTLRDRAEKIAREEMRAVVRTMQLEAQEVEAQATREEYEKLVKTLLSSPRKLWR
jgi:predicted DNA-binding mobile mystery protein A